MCLLVLAYQVDKDYPLIVAANRDEFYDRPSQPMHFWKDIPQLLAGKDLKAGGTWLGITSSGRFAAITNYRDPGSYNPNAESRGMLTLDYLTGKIDIKNFYNLTKQPKIYNKFNLICGKINDLHYITNVDNSIVKLKPGVHALSNALLNTPWYKVKTARKKMAEGLKLNQRDRINFLFRFLADRSIPPENELPDSGLSTELETLLSPVFIITDKYGTRSSTVLTVSKSGKCEVCEKNYAEEGQLVSEKSFKFHLNL